MATANQSVTADKLLSATVRYSNKDVSTRVYDISANARIENGQVINFDSGEVKKLSAPSENMDGMGNVATFNSYSPKSLNLYINNVEESEATSILSAVYAFMEDVRTNVNANPLNA